MSEMRILIVSNRLPITVRAEHGRHKIVPSSGGLATALSGLHESFGSLWIGWPGDTSHLNAVERQTFDRQLAALRTIPVHLNPSESSRFYDGFSNGVLWPLYHYLADKIERDAWSNWRTYVEVNQKFADAVQTHYRPGDTIWVHDYQLSLLPAMLRKRIPDAVIGYFLHIPFPSSEVFRILPWRTEILQGMLGADLIGFHTYAYQDHFARSLLHILDLPSSADGVVRLGDRRAMLGVFPIGIDTDRFEDLAATSAVQEEVRRIRAGNDRRRLILGVDRLDYTKGLPRRLLAIERFLEREPNWRDRFRFIQLIVPSREKIGAYAALRREMDELAGRINAAWGSISNVPIHYLYRSLPLEKLVALYQAADVMLVTPLRDGMNLVGKEYVACQVEETGVLILSEFAGAATELVEALSVNPYDVDHMAVQIKRALEMPLEERRSRMSSLRARVRGFNAPQWAARFMDSLGAAAAGRRVPGEAPYISDGAELNRLLDRVQEFDPLYVTLDYDGTLVPFAATPELAVPDQELLTLLLELAARPHTHVHLISGRSMSNLEGWFGRLPIALHAEHGFWSKTSQNASWRPMASGRPLWLERVRRLFERATRETPGSTIEEKSNSLAWHYRLVEPEFGIIRARALIDALRQEGADSDFCVIEGSKVVEVRRKGIHKGVIVKRLIEESDGAARVLAIGDDSTDEDMFQAVGSHGIAIHVGPGPSMTQYRLEDYRAARRFLQELIRR